TPAGSWRSPSATDEPMRSSGSARGCRSRSRELKKSATPDDAGDDDHKQQEHDDEGGGGSDAPLGLRRPGPTPNPVSPPRRRRAPGRCPTPPPSPGPR